MNTTTAQQARILTNDANGEKYKQDLKDIFNAVTEATRLGFYSVSVPPNVEYSFFVNTYLKGLGYKVSLCKDSRIT